MKDFSVTLLWEKIRLAVTCLGAWAARFLGGTDGMLIALLTLMALDCISGTLCAFADKNLSSDTGFRGLCKKALILMLVGGSSALDRYLGGGALLRGAVICFYLSNEALSLTENAARLGLPVPEKLKSALKQLREKSGENGEQQ